jgi:hypothetical protein
MIAFRLDPGARQDGDMTTAEPGSGTVFDPASGHVHLMDGLVPRDDEPVTVLRDDRPGRLRPWLRRHLRHGRDRDVADRAPRCGGRRRAGFARGRMNYGMCRDGQVRAAGRSPGRERRRSTG